MLKPLLIYFSIIGSIFGLLNLFIHSTLSLSVLPPSKIIIPLTVTQREDYSDIEKTRTNYTPAMIDLDKEALIKAQQEAYLKAQQEALKKMPYRR